MKLDVWHNILWSRYKAAVLTRLAELAPHHGIELKVYQFAETEQIRQSLTPIDLSLHRYPMELIFRGNYDAIPVYKRMLATATRALSTNADVVLISGYNQPEHWLKAMILRLRGKQIAVFCDSTANDNPRGALRTLAKRIFFKICPNSFSYGERARDYVMSLGVKAQNAFLRPQAADLPAGYDAAAIPALRLAQAPSRDAPRFLYVGRLDKEKALEVLIAAFARVHAEQSAARLVLVGGGTETESLKAQARKLSCEEAVVFSGPLDREAIAQTCLGATALVLPSRSEPWGLVVNEALHFGCPVIVSDACGCVPELVSDPACGLRVKVDDIGDLAERMAEAPAQFADVERVARTALRVIANNTPIKAAEALIAGALEIYRRAGGDQPKV